MSNINLTLHIWRQKDAKSKGAFVKYQVKDVSTHASFLEMLDILNEQLIAKGDEPVAFDHDCREGICGTCSLMINGRAHGGQKVPQGYYNIADMLGMVIRRSGEVAVCGSCMDARGIGEGELVTGAERGSMDILSSWTAEADKVIVF